MSIVIGGSGDDQFFITVSGEHEIDGGDGLDSLDLGALLRTAFGLTLEPGGAVRLDSLPGAAIDAHAVLRRMEWLVFDNGNDRIDLRTHFGAAAGPSVVITDDTPGTATGPVTFTLRFSEPVTGLRPLSFGFADDRVVTIQGNGTPFSSVYTVVFRPGAGFDGLLTLQLLPGGVTNAAGVGNAFPASAEQVYDLTPPRVTSIEPFQTDRGALVGTDLHIAFSEPVRLGPGSIVLQGPDGAELARFDARTSPALRLSGQDLTVDPPADLPSGTRISVLLTAGAVTDLAGQALPATEPHGFTTGTVGGPGAEDFRLGRGDQHLDGGDGIDRLLLPQPRAAYVLDLRFGETTVSGQDGSGTYRLDGVERLVFSDARLALDTSFTGHAGITAMTLGAVFGAESVRARPDYAGIGLALLDGGMSPLALMQLALDARLGAGAGARAVVDLVYENLVGAAPSASEEAYYVGLIDSQAFTAAGLALQASANSLNIDHIGLLGVGGLAETGLPFVG